MLHDPHTISTPSQRLFAAARTLRLAKIKAMAVPDRPIALHVPKFIEPAPEPVPVDALPSDSWTERQKKIPIPKAQWFSVLEEIEGTFLPDRPTIEQIQRTVCREYKMSRQDFLSERRTAPVVRARQIAMYLCKTLTLRSLPEIGRKFVGRDHTTVLHAVRKIAGLIASDPEIAAEVETLRAELSQ